MLYKKYLLNIALAMFICLSANAQAPGGNFNKPNPNWKSQDNRQRFSPELYMKKLNEFVTREAHLTEAESARFFPILREMQEKQHALMEKNRQLLFKSHRNNTLTEKDYEEIINKMSANDVEVKKLEQVYNKKFHTVLPWKKVFAVRMALNRWQMEALNHFRPERRDNQTFRPSWDKKK